MPKIQLITNVSDYGLFLGVAKTRPRLIAATATMLAVTAGAGLVAADYITESSSSVGLNLLIITAVMMLLLVASYFLAMLVGDLFFPGPWREQVLLGGTPQEGKGISIDDHNAEFMVVLILSVILNAFAVNAITGNFLGRYHAEGFYAVQMRSDDVEDRLHALRTIAKPINYKLWERPGLRKIVRDALDDPSQKVRERAYWTAGLLKDISAQKALISVLNSEANPAEKKAAAVALGKIDDPSVSRQALEALAEDNAAPASTIGALRGLGLLAQKESLDTALGLIGSENEEIMIHAYWLIRQIDAPEARPVIKEKIAANPTGKERCAAYDTFKMLATADDVMWARREFQLIDPKNAETDGCESVVWTDFDETKHYLLYGDSYREKLVKIVANADAFNQKDWFQVLVNDPEMPFRIRQVGTAILRQIEEAKYR